MRDIFVIDEITIHCSADVEGSGKDVNDIDLAHKKRGFAKQTISGMYCGYHFVIKENGDIQTGRIIDEIGAHCPPNRTRIGICYVGGLDKNRKPKDTRTIEQKISMYELVKWLKIIIPSIKKVKGHRDNSPDLDGDGIIEKHEWLKACPCFDVQKEFTLDELNKDIDEDI